MSFVQLRNVIYPVHTLQNSCFRTVVLIKVLKYRYIRYQTKPLRAIHRKSKFLTVLWSFSVHWIRQYADNFFTKITNISTSIHRHFFTAYLTTNRTSSAITAHARGFSFHFLSCLCSIHFRKQLNFQQLTTYAQISVCVCMYVFALALSKSHNKWSEVLGKGENMVTRC